MILLEPSWRNEGLFSRFVPNAHLDLWMLRSAAAWKEFVDARFSYVRHERLDCDFTHVKADMDLILHCLRGALASRTRGVHILLYGPPGTGKTTLAHTLAQRLGTALIEIRKEVETGEKSDGEARLFNFNLCQKLALSDSPNLVLFDEIEDLLPAPGYGQPPRRVHKGCICEALETAPYPTIWTGNSLWGIEPAILRRFTYTLELGVPPRKTRQAMLKTLVPKRGISKAWLKQVAANEHLTPALIQQLAQMADTLPVCEAELEDALLRWLNGRLAALRLPLLRLNRRPNPFRLELLNTDIDPRRLIDGLARSGEGRICLHGPPGTGKTAFARYIAERLERTAVIRRGSDLRSMWVGETERNVAEMFAEATRSDAVLILDEADGFLSHRAGRSQRWAVNECSEFLVQLEAFSGIFCATTNRFEELDPAFMRRFDLKIECDFLTARQRATALRHALREAGCAARVSKKSEGRLGPLDQLTPGDFVAAGRKLRLLDEGMNQDRLVSALVHEVECKNIHRGRPIGFR